MDKKLENNAVGQKQPKATGKTKAQVHAGHRGRLFELAINNGVENLTDVQAMELFLTYIIPRKDTNELSHRLLDNYNNFTYTLDASLGDLMRVYGIGKRAAQKIMLFRQYVDYYATARLRKKFKVTSYRDLIDVCEDYLRFQNTENCLMIAVSASRYITQTRRLKSESSMEVGIDMIEVSSFINSAKPSSFVIAHCHPYGLATPSGKDVEGYEKIKNFCETIGVDFIDSYIIGENGVYSQKKQELDRFYVDVEDLKNVVSQIAAQDK